MTPILISVTKNFIKPHDNAIGEVDHTVVTRMALIWCAIRTRAQTLAMFYEVDPQRMIVTI